MSSNEQAATEVKSSEGQDVEIVGEKKQDSVVKDQQQKVAEEPDTQAGEESRDSVVSAEGGNESAEGDEDDAGEETEEDAEVEKSATNGHAGKNGHEKEAAADSGTEVNGTEVKNLKRSGPTGEEASADDATAQKKKRVEEEDGNQGQEQDAN